MKQIPDQNLKELLMGTLNPNETVRVQAEKGLAQIEKNPEALFYIRDVLMNDSAPSIQQISSLYLVNVLRRNWKCPELVCVVRDFESRILDFLLIELRFPRQAFCKILGLILDNSSSETVNGLVDRSATSLGSSNDSEVQGALLLYEALFKSEELRYNMDDVLGTLYNNHGPLFLQKFTEMISKRNFQNAKMFMKIIARTYSHYTLPSFVSQLSIFSTFFDIAINITAIPNEEGKSSELFFGKFKKWAYFFLLKVANKGLKKYFKNPEFIEFIRNEPVLSRIILAFNRTIEEYTLGTVPHPTILLHTCDFFIIISNCKFTRDIIRNNVMRIVGSFILPIQSYNGEVTDNFEYDEDKYLSERYNYVSFNLRTASTSLFSEIIQVDKEVRNNVICSLREYLDCRSDSNYIAYKYGIIGMLANIHNYLASTLGKDNFVLFIENYILPELYSPHPFLVSQALHFLALCEDVSIPVNSSLQALKRVTELLGARHPVISVEATLAMGFFLRNNEISSAVSTLIPSLLEKVLVYSKQYFLDTLTNLMDTIIEVYSDEISVYAPQFADTLCKSAMNNLNSEDDNKIATVSGFLTTVEKLVMSAEDHPEIVRKIYESAFEVIYRIFENSIEDFYQEAFDLLNTFLFTLKAVDDKIFILFEKALTINSEDMTLYTREVSDFIDNCLSYGQDAFLNWNTLNLIVNSIFIFIKMDSHEETEIYDEEYKAGCRIIDSLMLNSGQRVVTLREGIINDLITLLVKNYKHVAESEEYLDLYSLESMMNCFFIEPQAVFTAMGNFSSQFIMESIRKYKKFSRVHDKKVFILFIGQLFKMWGGLEINYELLNEAFVEVFCSLPGAIHSRNKQRMELERDENNENNENTEDTSSYEESVPDSLEEDLWFETVLDKFDAYEFVRRMLHQPVPQSVGETAISRMTAEQVKRIQVVLSTKQEEQK